jgi:hypothetical protein
VKVVLDEFRYLINPNSLTSSHDTREDKVGAVEMFANLNEPLQETTNGLIDRHSGLAIPIHAAQDFTLKVGLSSQLI